jgi:ATP-dependent helicase YprA (DUF1998 family)
LTSEAPTIAETITEIRAALQDYIEAAYHVGHPALIAQRRELLEEEGGIFRAPFIESTPRYTTDRRFADLELDAAVQQLLASLTVRTDEVSPLLYDPPYTHQAQALESASRDGKSLVVTTGTGSGKTEAFLLPMIARLADEAAHHPGSFAAPAVRALILYPMNALVNDQLGRLRLLLGDPRVTTQFTAWAGRPARFARYTSRTLYPGVRTAKKDQLRLSSIEKFYVSLINQAADDGSPHKKRAQQLVAELKKRGKWPSKPDLKAWYGESNTRWQDKKTGVFKRAVMLPEDPELLTRHEVLAAPPDVLITNYSMLEYMLMRPLERPVFDATRAWLADNPDQRFLLIVDEAHLYRGAAGAEVALLLRRLRARLGIPADRLQVICTSASFGDSVYAREFAAQLSGKSKDDFETITGHLALREGPAAGTDDDATALAAVPMTDFQQASDDPSRVEAVRDFLDYRSVAIADGARVGSLLHDALNDFGPMSLLVNITMKQALPLDGLGATIFPTSDKELADRAVSALVALGSAARRSDDDAGLLPCRVHAFFRGLPGLWACLDPDCKLVDRTVIPPGPTGALYAQPQATCDCGARVFELYTCRQCGTAYARAYTDNVLNPSFLWNEPGGAFIAASGPITELQPLDLLLEPPAEENVEPFDLDLITGRLNPKELGDRTRGVFLRNPREGQADSGDDDDGIVTASGEFTPCGVCGQRAAFNASYVQDHQTKGDQPFEALVTRQLEVQPAGGKAYSDFAPLQGRKVLAFSDSRQVAARLAPNLQDDSMRDVIRPVVLRGWRELSEQPMLASSLNLDQLYLAAMVGAKILRVRLRPQLTGTESLQAFTQVAQAIDRGAMTDPAELVQLLTITATPPLSLLKGMTATLTHPYFGLAALGLASLRERSSVAAELLAKLPAIEGVATSEETKRALVRMWLAQWPKLGIWLSAMTTTDMWLAKGGVRGSTGKFRPIERWLGTPAAKREFNKRWLPELLATFCEEKEGKYRLLGSFVALEIDGEWGYCERCRFTQRPFPGSSRCGSCDAYRVRVLDLNDDDVFKARKGYYRASSIRALANPPKLPMSIIAAEHTAQLNSSQSADVFSKAEEHELLFQDVNVSVPRPGEQPLAAIDVLSCTTTMEVGIDIGSLSGVALRNMPPSRANYQQRAGRAGRRGNAVATVLAFGSADTHDDHYFRTPAAMISGPVDDPVLTMDNDEIARRHVTAYLLQRYHQDRLPEIDPDEMPPSLFEVLGTVESFVAATSPLNRNDLHKWLKVQETTLRGEVDGWLPTELHGADRERLLNGLVDKTMAEIDRALVLEPDGTQPEQEAGDVEVETEEVEAEGPAEDGAEEPSAQRSVTNLLDRLLYKGVLPRYAFPTDVVAFYVFDEDRSSRFRPEFQYAPSQGLPVALSQYAPGKVVWIDNREWTSGALYAPVRKELTRAWQDRRLYFECQDCHYAMHVAYGEAERGAVDDCPACMGDRFGPAMNWMRPPGFAHPSSKPPGTSPNDQPARSYATRAKLIAPGPAEESGWQRLTDRLTQTYDRQKLLVTNTGPKGEGYRYCVWCGLIEPMATASAVISGTHPKPYPDRHDPSCPGGRATRDLVLGTDFISDVLLIRLGVSAPVTLRPSFLATQVALRTVAEALTIASTRRLEIEATELQAEFRPALTQLGGHGLEAEIYLYDTLPGGAGFTQRVSQLGREIYDLALDVLEDCPAGCDESCYRCLRSFRNRFEHGMLDRHVGASLLRYLIHGTLPRLDAARLERSADKLYEDVTRSGVEGVTFARNSEVDVPGVGKVVAPILVTRGSQQFIFAISGPLTPDVAPTPELHDAMESQVSVDVRLIDDLVINRNLPSASRTVLEAIR